MPLLRCTGRTAGRTIAGKSRTGLRPMVRQFVNMPWPSERRLRMPSMQWRRQSRSSSISLGTSVRISPLRRPQSHRRPHSRRPTKERGLRGRAEHDLSRGLTHDGSPDHAGIGSGSRAARSQTPAGSLACAHPVYDVEDCETRTRQKERGLAYRPDVDNARMFARNGWQTILAILEKDWQPSLDGRAAFADALHDIVRDAR
jgi:hypothetical protein